MKKLITVLIATTKKNKESLRRLVRSLLRQQFIIYKVIIICDDPLDHEIDCEDTGLFPIEYISSAKRQSLTCAYNQAICGIKEEYIFLLNDDVVLPDNCVKELAKAMEMDESVGITCGKILRMDKEIVDSTGQFLAKNRKPQDRGYGQKDQAQYDIPGFVFGACGAAVLYRKKMLDDIRITPGEYFDNDYHMFYEDLDIAWRAQNAGWKAYYNPKAVVYHVRGASARSRKPPLKLFERLYFPWLDAELKSHFIKNRWMTIIKNDTLKDFSLNLPYILWYDIKILFYCLFFDPLVLIKVLKNLPFIIIKAFKKRRLIKRNK
ncbi:MAG: glycosyltransferase [Candidatus Omnitrophica bacterium]|nr:glycosyltransferase [Candidatus Omnitrophota bacterium]MBU1924644.1 glycosyltransferase [Candidatus Omnitrophota bacterium]